MSDWTTDPLELFGIACIVIGLISVTIGKQFPVIRLLLGDRSMITQWIIGLIFFSIGIGSLYVAGVWT
ncbi:hypothetical protein GOP80_07335 [Planococcaceae bacterium Storch 2/2-2]|nr:hypothetical protein [Planococcaceae bacterium Storch 2/2-2]